MNISTGDFSVIIQGPIIGKSGDPEDKQLTTRCIRSIRQHLPGAEIIISTWEGEETAHLDLDKVTYSKDPGAVSYNDFELKNVYNNNNRQITTTLAGLKLSSRKFSIKIRGDFYFENSGFISFIDKYKERYKYEYFSSRVIVPTYFFRDPEKVPVLYHISDLFMAGYTTDLIRLWDIPLQPEPETTRAFDYKKQFANDPYRKNQYKMRYASEQYIWYAFCKKAGLDLSLKYYCEMPADRIKKAIASTIDNFVIASPQQLGLVFPERLLHGDKQLYTFEKWEKLYNELCINKSHARLTKAVLKAKLVSANFVFKNLMKTLKGKK